MSLSGFSKHADHPFFAVADDCLTIGDQSLLDVAKQAARTPFYAYGRQYMSARVADLRRSLPQSIQLHYAIKANPMPAVVRHMAPLVDGFDVASAGELRIAIDAGMEPERISFAGPGKTPQELAEAVAAGVVLNVESEREVARLVEIARQTGSRPRIAVRVNPDFELKTSGMKMGGGPKPFGVDAERVPQLLAQIARMPLELMGLHIFSGSQNLRAESIVESQQKSFELAVQLSRGAAVQLRTLNIGGGFGIPYFAGEKPLDLQPIAAGLKALLERCSHDLPGTQIIIELGRYLVGEAGIYVCKVIDRKVSRGQVFLVTDGGLHHHLAASGNFGQVIRKNYPVLVGNRVHGEHREIASVVGPLCTPLDLLADRVEMARAEIDDLVVVLQSGAYGLTASPAAFLSHPAAAEILV
jgi:diaminopimelate decarboxylase